MQQHLLWQTEQPLLQMAEVAELPGQTQDLQLVERHPMEALLAVPAERALHATTSDLPEKLA